MKKFLTTLCAFLFASVLSAQAWQTNVWTRLDSPPGSGSGVPGSGTVALQASSPGTAQVGNLNLTATGIFGNLGINANGTATARIEVEAADGQFALNAVSSNTTALVGTGNTGDGLSGVSTDGYGATGYSVSSHSGFFQSSDETNALATLAVGKVTSGATAPLFEVQDHLGAAKFRVSSTGDLTILQGVTLDWPAANAAGVLTNDGAGALSWAAGGGGFAEQDKIDLAWDKKFFSDLAVLPATERIAATLVTFPTEGGTEGTVTFTKNNGWANMANTGTALVWYDLGAAHSDILVVVSGYNYSTLTPAFSLGIWSAEPTTADPDGYIFGQDGTDNIQLNRRSGGTYTQIGSNVTSWTGRGIAWALYYKDSTNTLTGFVRVGGRWVQVLTGTDSTFTTLRYVGFRGTNTARPTLPFTVWTE